MPVALARRAACADAIVTTAIADSLWPRDTLALGKPGATRWRGSAPLTKFWERSAMPLHAHGPLEPDRLERDRLAACLAEIALAAGPAVMEVYASGGTVSTKSDGSPVTLADERAEAIICDLLARLLPTTPVVAGGEGRRGRRRLDRRQVPACRSARRNARSSSPATASSRSISRSSTTARRSPARSTRRRWRGSGSAASARSRCDAPVGAALPDPAAWRPISHPLGAGAPGRLASRSHADAATEAFLARLPLAERRLARLLAEILRARRGAAPTSIPASVRRWNGTPPPATPCCAPPGRLVCDCDGAPLPYGKARRGLAQRRASSPGATRPRRNAFDSVNNPLTPIAENGGMRAPGLDGTRIGALGGSGCGKGAQVWRG